MLLRVLIVSLTLISTTYPMDWEDYRDAATRHQNLKPDTFVYNPDFFERKLDGRITLSRIVAMQRVINDESPVAPPNTPIFAAFRGNSCWSAFFGVIPTLVRLTVTLLNVLKG